MVCAILPSTITLDTIDPNSTDNDVAGTANWFNEFFAKDTSRKIRAVQKAKGEQGIPLTTNIPSVTAKTRVIGQSGSMRQPLLVGQAYFAVGRKAGGRCRLHKLLQAEQVLNPTAYKRREGINTPSPETVDPYHWNPNITVVHILERREYTDTVNFKTHTNSIWGQEAAGNAHWRSRRYSTTPIRLSLSRKSLTRCRRSASSATEGQNRKSSLFSGMVYCADCGAKMRYCTTNYFEKRQDHFVRQLPQQHWNLFNAFHPGGCNGRIGLDAHENGYSHGNPA